MPSTNSVSRRQRLRIYLQTRREMEMISDRDLADMGVKRYQLGAAARVKALG